MCQCSEDSYESCKDTCVNCKHLFALSHVDVRQGQIQYGLLLEYFAIGRMLVEVTDALDVGYISFSFVLMAFEGFFSRTCSRVCRLGTC